MPSEASPNDPETRLVQLGITLTEPAMPLGAYVPAVRSANQLHVSGQLPLRDGVPLLVGRLGEELDAAQGAAAARQCAVNVLAVLRAELGDLGRVVRIVRVGGYVASTPDFTAHPAVVNGASDLFGEVFGARGRHARAAVGVVSLPLGVPVEIEALVEVDTST